VPELVRFSQISPARQALVRLCQAANHGRIDELQIRDSEPVLSPAPSILFDVKLDSEEEPRPELGLSDFVLSREVCRLLDRLDEIENGRIERLEVRAVIPRRMVFESRLFRSQEVRR
jgi:hypothetical protein